MVWGGCDIERAVLDGLCELCGGCLRWGVQINPNEIDCCGVCLPQSAHITPTFGTTSTPFSAVFTGGRSWPIKFGHRSH